MAGSIDHDHEHGQREHFFKDKDKTILFLNNTEKEDINKIGGKALNLSILIKGKFPVPEGFAITVDIYEKFLFENGLKEKIIKRLDNCDISNETELQSCSEEIIQWINNGRIQEEILNEIENTIKIIDDDTLWAVRSSAVAEDLPEASFAGQQDTFLNVRREDVPEYVKRCWASFWNFRAIAYRHQANIPQVDSGIAVVVQKMVDAKISGVMFTADPVNPVNDNIIIESSWGLGESIVSGIVSPDKFTCDKKTGNITGKKVNKKTKGIFLSMDGKVVDIETTRQMLPSLTENEANKLATIGMEIERYFGSPQDIEWAISGEDIHILQSRPITTLEKKNETLWTRAYGDEYWADVTSPLFFSLLGEYLSKYVLGEGNQIMGYHELRDKQLLKLHKGHIYFNSEVLEIVFTFNPKFSRTKELLNYFPEKDQPRIQNAPTKIFRRLLAELRIAILDRDGMITKTNDAYNKWAENYIYVMKRYDALDLKELSDAELYDEYKNMENAFIKHFRLIRYGMVTHSIGTNLMIKRWLTDWLDDKSGQLYSGLISGLKENKTIQTNIAIWKVSRAIRECCDDIDQLLKEDHNSFIDRIHTDPTMKEASLKYDEFIREYGHRSHTREIYFPRWADDQSLIVDVLKALLSSQDLDLVKIEKEKIQERLSTEKDVLDKVSKLKFGFFKRAIFKIVLKYAQTYLIFRENQRFYLDHILFRERRLFMEYGRRYAEKGIIDDIEDIFFLSKEEIFSIGRGEKSPEKEVIRYRRSEFEKYKDILPQKFLKGKTEFDDTVIHDENIMRITGTSASPGIATGIVRVVESIKELSVVKENEILVTSNTDPGWTPVFSKLAGLITETGGILSHGAVVSREYGIPAVTAVKNARKLLKTGQKVTIDGNDGIIYIMEK
ncbi:phosphoenolpyruvate protein kinase [Methanocella sp. CWC-04]|uniref:Phosphoenolpyruvate protein kinase n=1 Tax=Methanooceanicella nereidis TaxID=2052831 RepID=A0AAP2RFH0_9EURY|nr:PEP/pyruvate-binding domain-containing protein [Methanocella sp. CWC-04]MCD1295836.1 phosphoenolpyruvate protein kinase [Methanocella sp. CWC-04]